VDHARRGGSWGSGRAVSRVARTNDASQGLARVISADREPGDQTIECPGESGGADGT
jgi:hypothetical protein